LRSILNQPKIFDFWSAKINEAKYQEEVDMKYSEAKQGRVFIIRLEHGDIVHEQIEQFALHQSINAAALIIVGGAGEGSKLVVGPEKADQSPIVPMIHTLQDVHEVAGTGTIFWDNEAGRPTAHIHIACGRKDSTFTGCIRRGVKVWQTMEIVLFELTETSASRFLEPKLGFKVLQT
jgi:predicted DNA-binding protein with PD1-like motif